MEFDTRVAAYGVIVDERDRILLALWNGEGHTTPQWTMPGGGVELDETVEQAAVRELREETGYEVELGPVLGIDCFTVPTEQRFHGVRRPLKGVRVVYEARIVGGELTHEAGGSTDEARWVSLDEVPELNRAELVDAAVAFWRQRLLGGMMPA
jgi:8-oxo-dGTP diphosphatase